MQGYVPQSWTLVINNRFGFLTIGVCRTISLQKPKIYTQLPTRVNYSGTLLFNRFDHWAKD